MDDASTDHDLLSRIRSGSGKAFEALYRRHSKTVLAYAHRVCRTSDADDIVSDTWERVWTNPPEDTTAFEGWIKLTIRREAWRRARAASDDGSVRESLPGMGTTPSRQVARHEALDLLEQAVSQGDLSLVEFSAIVLNSEGWAPKQCCEAEGVSRTAWSDRLARARKKLRRLALGEAAAARPRR